MSIDEENLNYFLEDYRLTKTAVEGINPDTDRIYKTITVGVEQRRKTPRCYFTRGIIPYFSQLDDYNQFTIGLGSGLTAEYARFASGITYMRGITMEPFYDLYETRDAEHGNIGYTPNGINMYGAFKVMYDRFRFLSQYPVFYSITGGNDPYAVASFTGVTEKGSSAGCYTMVNFGGTIVPFQLMFDPSTLGISSSNGLPTGTAGNPLYYGQYEYSGSTSSVKSLYFLPDIHLSLRRSINLHKSHGLTFAGILARFQPHYDFIKYADDAFVDTQTGMITKYAGSSANPAWTEELRKFNGNTLTAVNKIGFQLANDFNNRFFDGVMRYPARYNLTMNSYNAGHWGFPFVTEVVGWQQSIPNPGYAIDATGPYIPEGNNYYVYRISGLTLNPAPAGYTMGSGMSGWNSYRKGRGITEDTAFYGEYFMLGNTTQAASATYQASNLIPTNILTFFYDDNAGKGPDGITLNYLESYYYNLYAEALFYGGYAYQNVFPMYFVPRFNPAIPMQETGTIPGSSPSRRDSTIHRDFGTTATERRYNLKRSMSSSINAATRTWKIILDGIGKFNYRIIPVIQGRNEDYDLTRGGCVPYSPSDFVEYLMAPLFTGDVPANGFIMTDDIHEKLLSGFYYGNIARGSAEYNAVVTNKGISGSDPTTSFVRGLETYFFDLERLQNSMSTPNYLDDVGLTAAAASHGNYKSIFNSGRFTDYRVFENNTGTTGGNTVIPYGFTGAFRWNLVPLRTSSILNTDQSLKSRWISDSNNNITTAYQIIRDAYFELTKQQLDAAFYYFEINDITTFVEYRATDKAIGR